MEQGEGTLTKHVLTDPSLCCCPSHSSVLTSVSPPNMTAVKYTPATEMLNLLFGCIQAFKHIFVLLACFTLSCWQPGDASYSSYMCGHQMKSFGKKKWLPLSSSRAYSSIPYPFSYQVGVVGLAFLGVT